MIFLKKFYSFLPGKKILFSIIKKIYVPKENIYRHLHFTGQFKVKLSQHKTFRLKHYGSGFTMESDFFWMGYGGTEKISCLIWEKLSEQSSIIFDIGANTGIYSLIAYCSNQSSEIFSFEPSERVFEKLKENIALNYYTIHPFPLAISERSGKVTYFDNDTENPYLGSLKNDNTGKKIKAITIDAISLDDFITKKKIGAIDLIKIDVEAYEPEVLKSMKAHLPKFKPTLLIEILNQTIADELTAILAGINYEFYNIDENKGLIKTDKLEKGILNNYLICTKEIFKKADLKKYIIS